MQSIFALDMGSLQGRHFYGVEKRWRYHQQGQAGETEKSD